MNRWGLVALLMGVCGFALASQPMIVSLTPGGHMTWSEPVDVPAGYRIEFAGKPDGPWRQSWENFRYIGVRTVGATTNVSIDIPLFYRVVRVPGFSDIPNATTDADYYDDGAPLPAKVELGRMLFFDKILSGNRNISCATCHHSLTATGDGLSLPVGEGGRGLGVTRDTGVGADAVHERVPRNAPHVFNLGARDFGVMFHDGRLELDGSSPHGIRSPAGSDLPAGLDNVLAAQAMFPVTSGPEMAGQPGENDIADHAATNGLTSVWLLLADRLRTNDTYVALFQSAYTQIVTAADISYVHAANAIGAFEAVAWRADRSPFDYFLRGDNDALSGRAFRGMELFYGKARCSDCHSGTFQTDQAFHAIAMPQVGPGKGDGSGGREDFGRERVTSQVEDRFKFRTPSLRNVALTGPWGHAGAYDALEAVVRHHLDPVTALHQYNPDEAVMPVRADLDALDRYVHTNAVLRTAIADANEAPVVSLTDEEVRDLIEFLHALTDRNSLDLRNDVPMHVPSGLPVFD